MINLVTDDYFHTRGLFLDCLISKLSLNVPKKLNLTNKSANDKITLKRAKNLPNFGVYSSTVDPDGNNL